MYRIAFLSCLLIAFPAMSCELPDPAAREANAADAFELESLKWDKRVILLFAASPRDPAYARQQELFAEKSAEMTARDLVVVAAFADGSGMLDGRPIDTRSVRALRRDFQPRANAFSFVLVGKDGTEKMRVEGKPAKPAEVFDTIDAMPMRQTEMKEDAKDEPSGQSGKDGK
jgi:hypothetical protein